MPIDIVFLAVFFYGFWQGYSRGIIGTVFNILAYTFGITVAFKITPTTTNILERLFNSQNPTMFLAAFIVNLIFIMFILRMAAKSMEGVFETAYLGVLNQIIGGALVGSISVVIYSVLIWFLVQVQFLNEATISESRAYPFLKDLPGKAKTVAIRIKPFAEDFWGTSMNWVERLQKYGDERVEGKSKIYEVPDKGKGVESAPDAAKPASSPVSDEGTGIED